MGSGAGAARGWRNLRRGAGRRQESGQRRARGQACPEWSLVRRPPPLGLSLRRSPPSPPGRGRARRAAGARGGAGGGGQCETGWCCCARVCSGPRCTSGCGCAPRRPPAPPGPAPQVRSWGPAGQAAARGERPTPSPPGGFLREAPPGVPQGGGGGTGRTRPSPDETNGPFHRRGVKSGRLEGAFLSACPRGSSPPAFLYGHGTGVRHRESFVCPPGLVGAVRRLPAGPGSKTLCPSAAGGCCVSPGSGAAPPAPSLSGWTYSVKAWRS